MIGTPKPRIRSHDGRNIYLDESPSVDETDEWLLELGCQKKKVGKTVQGRDIHLYSMDYFHSLPLPLGQDVDPSSKNILFLSLVHGNEPMGLVALLMGAKYLAKSSSPQSSNRQSADREQGAASARIYFLPIVNADAYEINLRQGEERRGCQRMNLRPTCMPNTTVSRNDTIVVQSCDRRGAAMPAPFFNGGVDLNRNFPTDWEGSESECKNPGGPHPLSEPETQAIAAVVETFNITQAMSLHSMSHSAREPLMIHPFASSRPFHFMNETDARRFREWSAAMNRKVNSFYVTGTAQEAIKYTAGGCTIDWMYSEKKITSFVLEVVPPCEIRWCRGRNVYRNADPHAVTMKNFVHLSLAADQNWDLEDNNNIVSINYPEDWNFENDTMGSVPILLVFLLGIVYATVKRRHNFRLFLYRFGLPKVLRVKERPTEDERVEVTVELSPTII
mmetsp:Transcript_10033/g.25051  ORF Transcript_10033/g.25051 Transcript_10033/m.25051 type:complete len:447 (-) Transcript_10033:13-1353(-)